MSSEDAVLYVEKIKKANNPRHVATDTWRSNAIAKLNRDEGVPIALVEIYLKRDVTDMAKFAGIFFVDDIGIWYYDGDGHIDDYVWRQRVIQWSDVDQIVLHQGS